MRATCHSPFYIRDGCKGNFLGLLPEWTVKRGCMTLGRLIHTAVFPDLSSAVVSNTRHLPCRLCAFGASDLFSFEPREGEVSSDASRLYVPQTNMFSKPGVGQNSTESAGHSVSKGAIGYYIGELRVEMRCSVRGRPVKPRGRFTSFLPIILFNGLYALPA